METHDAETPDSPRSALESAIQAVERSLCADGSRHGGIPEGEQSGNEWRALFQWAQRSRRRLLPKPENSLCTDGLTCHVLCMGSFHTDFLTATSTPLTGAGTILNIFGNYHEFNQSNTPQQADALAIIQDWGMVSQDFRDSLHLGLKELSKELENV